MTTVAEAVEDHADQLEATSADFTIMRKQLSAYERQMVEGLNTAEAKLTDKFTELEKSVSELRQQTTTTAAELAARAAGAKLSLAVYNWCRVQYVLMDILRGEAELVVSDLVPGCLCL